MTDNHHKRKLDNGATSEENRTETDASILLETLPVDNNHHYFASNNNIPAESDVSNDVDPQLHPLDPSVTLTPTKKRKYDTRQSISSSLTHPFLNKQAINFGYEQVDSFHYMNDEGDETCINNENLDGFLSSQISAHDRDVIRTSTQKFVTDLRKNEQQYIQHVVRYVSSIIEVNRVINVGEWFGTAETEKSCGEEHYNSRNDDVIQKKSIDRKSIIDSQMMPPPGAKPGIFLTAPPTELIFLPKIFATIIKPHQLEGLRFCWSNIVLPNDENLKGCILNHS